ncbi:MAG: response regulator transcription factor [Candidatus Zixiibacteriota bacterium]
MSKKILIVDDDQDLLRGLNVRLKASGYTVIFATDAMYAVSNARKERPDLIILDIGLPGGDGFLVMDRLKSNSTLAAIPIIILSARDPQVNREKALEHGAVAFLQKPADNFVLMATIQKVIGEPGNDITMPKDKEPEKPNSQISMHQNNLKNQISKAKELGDSTKKAPDFDKTPIDKDDSKMYRQFAKSNKEVIEGSEYSQKPKKKPDSTYNIEPKTPNKTHSSAKSILVVDDDHDLLLGMSVRLMAYGYNVFFTYDVVSAIAKAKKVKPDLIILDIGLPGGDGFTVMERMKKIPSIAKIPVIILTAREPRKNRQKAIEMGAIGFFQKPANNNELISAIRKVLK